MLRAFSLIYKVAVNSIGKGTSLEKISAGEEYPKVFLSLRFRRPATSSSLGEDVKRGAFGEILS